MFRASVPGLAPAQQQTWRQADMVRGQRGKRLNLPIDHSPLVAPKVPFQALIQLPEVPTNS